MLEKSVILEGRISREQLEYYLNFDKYIDCVKADYIVQWQQEEIHNMANEILYKFNDIFCKIENTYYSWLMCGFTISDNGSYCGSHGGAFEMHRIVTGRLFKGPAMMTPTSSEYIEKELDRKQKYEKDFKTAYDKQKQVWDHLQKVLDPIYPKSHAGEPIDYENERNKESASKWEDLSTDEKTRLIQESAEIITKLYYGIIEIILEFLPGRPFIKRYGAV